MAVEVQERSTSRRGSMGSSGLALIYLVRNTDSDVAATAAVEAEAPLRYRGLRRQSVELEPLGVWDNDPEHCLWEATVPYRRKEESEEETNEEAYQFEVGGMTEHIQQSIATRGAYGPGASTPPNFYGAINVERSGNEINIRGADVESPQYDFSMVRYLPLAYVTGAYKVLLADMAYTINNATFRAVAAGDCLFRGVSGSQRGDTDWEVTFRFSVGRSWTNRVIPTPWGNIVIAHKRGWDYVWTFRKPYKITYTLPAEGGGAPETKELVIEAPCAAYVEQVYYESNFARLGIGT